MDTRASEGIAMVVVVMAMLLMAALAAALALTTSTEVIIAGNFRSAAEGLYAADGMLERAISDLRLAEDWTPLLDGTLQSSFVDDAPGQVRTLPNGVSVDLSQVRNLANCRKASFCTAGEMDAVTADRPWGANNPRWQIYAYGPLSRLLPAGAIASQFYGVVMVADDPSEVDGNPLRDGEASSPGAGVLDVRAEAFGPRGAHAIVEMTIARPGGGHDGRGLTQPRVLSWRQIR